MQQWEYLRLSLTYEKVSDYETRSVVREVNGQAIGRQVGFGGSGRQKFPKYKHPSVDPYLARLGAEGWELVTAVWTNLRAAILWLANLQAADLRFADLQGAILRDTNLQAADFTYAKLQGADFTYAKLQAADFTHAKLQQANLHRANLQEASLHEANLQGIKHYSLEQLSEAKSLDGATTPDGTQLKGQDNPDGPSFEEWAKSYLQAEDEVDQRAVEEARQATAGDTREEEE